MFQSHNGAIAAEVVERWEITLPKFQSHNGAIAACQKFARTACRRAVFQSHNGAIAAVTQQQWFTRTWSFNPTMVRLLPLISRCAAVHISLFQSHNGAIAAAKLFITGVPIEVFQSHNGAIAAQCRLEGVHLVIVVSIPQWCDCCIKYLQCAQYIMPEFQSHNGAIAASTSQSVSSATCLFQSHNGAIAAPIWLLVRGG